MGCGRSKEKVASGSTVGAARSNTGERAPSAAGDYAKDIAAVADAEGKLIGRDPSDRYFSTRKDEVGLEAAEIGSGGYRTPLLAEDHAGTPPAWGSSKDPGIEEEEEEEEGIREKDRAVEVAAAAVVEKTKAAEKGEGSGAAEGGKISATNLQKADHDENGDQSKNSANSKEPTSAAVAAEEEEKEKVEKTHPGESKTACN